MRILRKRALLGSVGVVAVLAGSITISSLQTASAASSPPSQTVNQGTGGTSAWKVAGNVTVSGTVSVGNFPAPGTTDVLAVESGHGLDTNHFMSTGPIDTSAYKEVKLLILCGATNDGDCANVHVDVGTEPGSQQLDFDQFTLTDYSTTSRIEEIPGLSIGVGISNDSPDEVSISYAVIGRTN